MFQCVKKGPVTQAPITRMKTITIKMHTLDWLNERGRILRGAIQPIASVHFYRSLFRSRYRGLCDRALRHVWETLMPGKKLIKLWSIRNKCCLVGQLTLWLYRNFRIFRSVAILLLFPAITINLKYLYVHIWRWSLKIYLPWAFLWCWLVRFDYYKLWFYNIKKRRGINDAGPVFFIGIVQHLSTILLEIFMKILSVVINQSYIIEIYRKCIFTKQCFPFKIYMSFITCRVF